MPTFKTLVKTTFTPIALCLSLAIVAPAMANKGHHQHDGMRKILSELSLTDTQKQDIKQLLKQNREDRKLFSEDKTLLKTDLRSLIQASQWDEVAVKSALSERQALIQQKALQRAANKNQVWNLLTASQQAEFVTQQEIRQAKQDVMRGEGKAKSKRKGQKLKRLDLTQEQLTAVTAIKTAEKDSAASVKAKLKNFKQAEQALIQSTSFKAEEWQALWSEYQADFTALALIKTKSKYDLWNILTPEQQDKSLQISEKRKLKGKNKKKSRDS